nr:photochlorophyllide reductase subunit B [Celtis australis]UOA66407.1 photochlorophyllide reductase subunit B [Celtis australis]
MRGIIGTNVSIFFIALSIRNEFSSI